MKFDSQSYLLPDHVLLNGRVNRDTHMVWAPLVACVVIGYGNSLEQSLHLNRVTADGIEVYRRPSGGEAVLVSPETLVVSAVTFNKKLQTVNKGFTHFNGKIIRALQALGMDAVRERGISDIAYKDKKIAGSAIYLNKDRLFYHAVLNLNEPPWRISTYLKYPKKEPDYRQGRAHEDFVTSLAHSGYPLRFNQVRQAIEKEFNENKQN